ncbi:hypothetical protein [Elongatibacter sediminis]|uniref:Uncharacterized protein n=1 Tax=Elongatibacter sediminis TaxID=3119006 RepID=A0AAW9RFA6_9GAMM
MSEKLQLNGFLDAVKLLLIRELYPKEREVFTKCDIMVRDYDPFFFGHRYTQSWWRLQSPRELTFLSPWVDEEIQGIDATSSLRKLEEITARL